MLPIKSRLSFFYVERGSLTVIDGCLVLTDADDGVQYQVPARATTLLMLGPGTSFTTEAARLAAAYGVLVTWVGEHGVRCYSAGRPWTDNTEWLDRQVTAYADPAATLRVAREMFFRRFGIRMERRSIDQLRGLEGSRVREIYRLTAERFGIRWQGRKYVRGNPDGDTDGPNLALNVANTCLYGLCESAVLATGMSPALGFIHRGSSLSFVLDLADLYKAELTIPLAFEVVKRKAGRDGEAWPELERDVRRACRDRFRESELLGRVIDDAHEVVCAGSAT